MPTDITTTPGGKTGKSSDTKSKESKSGNQRKTQVIMEFLGGCTPYEADALRSMLSIAAGKSTLRPCRSMTAPHSTAISTSDATRKRGCGAASAHIGRKRALILMKSVSQYVGKEEIIDITTSLLTVSSDRQDIQTVLNNLPKLQTTVPIIMPETRRLMRRCRNRESLPSPFPSVFIVPYSFN